MCEHFRIQICDAADLILNLTNEQFTDSHFSNLVSNNYGTYYRSLLSILKLVPEFHPLSLYLLFDCSITLNNFRVNLSRLEKKGLVKSVAMTSKDNHLKKTYHVTSKGFLAAGDFISLTPENIKKFMKHSSKLSFHNFGIGMATLSLLYSPLHILQLNYEYAFTLDPSAVSRYRKMIRAHRPDAVYAVSYGDEVRTLYLEHDTGSETQSVLVSKIQEYILHNIFDYDKELSNASVNGTDCLIFSSHCLNHSLPSCFRPSELNKLVSEPNCLQIDVSSIPSVLMRDTSLYMNGDINLLDPITVTRLSKDITGFINRDMLEFLRFRQRTTALSRRINLFTALLPHYFTYLRGETGALNFLFHLFIYGAFSLPYSATCDLPLLYPFLFPKSYPSFLTNSEKGLWKYTDGRKVIFIGQFYDVILDNRTTFRYRNAFKVTDSSMIFCLENGCDIGALYRGKCLLASNRLSSCHFSLLYWVDSYKEAFMIGKALDPEDELLTAQGQFHKKGAFIYFCMKNTFEIFSLCKNNEIIELEPMLL